MKFSKTYYGGTFLGKEELTESNINHEIELEYYTIKDIKDNTKANYGIEIIKKEYKESGIDIEKSNIENVSYNKSKVVEIIDTLKKYKVTPIGLNDVLEDLLRIN